MVSCSLIPLVCSSNIPLVDIPQTPASVGHSVVCTYIIIYVDRCVTYMYYTLCICMCVHVYACMYLHALYMYIHVHAMLNRRRSLKKVRFMCGSDSCLATLQTNKVLRLMYATGTEVSP